MLVSIVLPWAPSALSVDGLGEYGEQFRAEEA
jgi:hypothetical protein